MAENPIDPPAYSAQDASMLSVQGLSKRGQTVYEKIGPFLKKGIFDKQYAPETPDGSVNLGIAQNSLCQKELIEFFESHLKLRPADFTYGDAAGGSLRLKAAYAQYVNHAMRPVIPIDGEKHLWCSVGVGSVIDGLSFALAEEGAGVLIAMPYYNGFDFDFTQRASLIPIGVDISQYKDPLSPETLNAFESQLEASKKAGTPIRIVMFCNPHNPYGQSYPRETILAYARFCEKHDLHLLSDEIYASSTFVTKDNPSPLPYISMLSIDLQKEAGCDPARVHVLHGMSKDFDSNGFRLGFVISQHNEKLLTALNCLGILTKPSSASEALWAALLEDKDYLDRFLKLNQKRLGQAFDYASGFLKAHKIPYISANAGHFFLVNLRGHLPLKDADGKSLDPKDLRSRETALAALFVKNKVLVSPGANYHVQEPGWFRLTHSIQKDYIKVGFKRFERTLGLDSLADVWDV